MSLKKRSLLFLIILLAVISNFTWLLLDKQPPEGNGLQDLLPAIEFYHYLKDNGITSFFKAPLFAVYPPLVPWSYALFYLIFGTAMQLELMVNSIYLGIMLLSVYGIGKYMASEKVGLLASFIVSSFPSVIALSRLIYAEFNLMCLTTLTVYLLLKSEYFTSRKYSVLLGISLALVALTKWEFPPMLIGPFMLVFYQAKSKFSNTPYKTKLFNFSLSLLLGFILSSFWYIPNFRNVYWRLFVNPNESVVSFAGLFPHKSLLSLNNLCFYLVSLINNHIFLVYSFLLILVLLYALIKFLIYRNKLKIPYNIMVLILWVVIPYIAFTFVKIKGESHVIAMLPPIAIVLSMWIYRLKGIIRKLVLIMVILYGLSLHAHPFYNPPLLGQINHAKFTLNYSENKLHFKPYLAKHSNEVIFWPTKGFAPPDDRDWKIGEVLSFIRDDSPLADKDPVILILSREIEFNWPCFQYVNLINFKSHIVPSGNLVSCPPSGFDIDYIVLKYNYGHFRPTWNVILRSTYYEFAANLGRYSWINEHVIKGKKGYFKDFTLLKEFLLPDGSYALVFKLNKKLREKNV